MRNVTKLQTMKQSEARRIAKNIKETMVFVASDEFEGQEVISVRDETNGNVFELPDNTSLRLGNPTFECTEILFSAPLTYTMVGHGQNISKQTNLSITKHCNTEKTANEMYGNIVCCGGTSMIEGFCQRLEDEIQQFAPDEATCKVIADNPQRKYFSYHGAKIMSHFIPFITKKEYDEYGPNIVHKKCVQ